MLLIKYLLLSMVQGFTEPLPISSSGHIKIIKAIMNNEVLSDINFEIIVNFGSLIGVLILYRNEIKKIVIDFFKYIKYKDKIRKTNFNYGLFIIISTIPAGIFGIFLKDFIEEYFTIKMIGLMFIITSLLLYKVKDIKGSKEKKDITFLDSIKIGLYEVIALFPGISRSGATLVGSLMCNLKREEAVNYSFMLYIPISIASFILAISDLIKIDNLSIVLIPYIISMIVSGIITYYSSKLFINIIKKGKIIYFSIYCFIIGFLVTILF